MNQSFFALLWSVLVNRGGHNRSCLVTCTTEFTLKRKIQITNTSYLSFDLFALLTNLKLVAFHTLVHLVKVVALLVEVSVLLCQNRLMLLQEIAEFVQFTLF